MRLRIRFSRVLPVGLLFFGLLAPCETFATALEVLKPGQAAAADVSGELGDPIETTGSDLAPVARYEAAGKGLKSVTAWYDSAGILRWAKVELVNQLDVDTASILFTLRDAPSSADGNSFSPAQSEGRTTSYAADGIHFYVVAGIVTEIWITPANAQPAQIARELAAPDVPVGPSGQTQPAADDTLKSPSEIVPPVPEPVAPYDEQAPIPSPVGTTAPEPPVPPDVAVPPAGTPVPVPGPAPERVVPPSPPAGSRGMPQEQAWFGTAIVTATKDTARQYGVGETPGAIVIEATPGGPAQKAGIVKGDIIIAFSGQPIRSADDLVSAVAAKSPGASVQVDYVRAGRTVSATVTLGRHADKPASAESPRRRGDLGFVLKPVTAEIARDKGLTAPEGAYVSEVIKGHAAERAGLKAGDVITTFDGKKILRIEDLRKLTSGSAPGTPVKLDVVRDGQPLSLNAVIEEMR